MTSTPGGQVERGGGGTVTLLAAEVAARLRAAPFSYSEVGSTALELPPGYPVLSKTASVTGRDFQAAADALLGWEVQRRAGVRVAASAPRVQAGEVVMLRLGAGRVAVSAPCRVVYVINEPLRQGFAYGTLPGHPESGEESFLLTSRADGGVEFTITAFSRAATRLARVGGPVTRVVQRQITRRYLRALNG